MNWIRELKVGDTVYATNSQYSNRNPKGITECKVTKIGRKYVTVESEYGRESQFDLEHGSENSDFTPRTLVRSVEEHKESTRRESFFYQLLRSLNLYWQLDNGVTSDDILAAAKLLKIEMKDPV